MAGIIGNLLMKDSRNQLLMRSRNYLKQKESCCQEMESIYL